MSSSADRSMTIAPQAGFLDSSLVVLALLVLCAVSAVFSVLQFLNGQMAYGIVLACVFVALTLGTLYCAAFLVRKIKLGPADFVLTRPFGRLWIKPLKTDLLRVPLRDIRSVLVTVREDSEGEYREKWKITVHNGSSVDFIYSSDKDDLKAATAFFAARNIHFSRQSL